MLVPFVLCGRSLVDALVFSRSLKESSNGLGSRSKDRCGAGAFVADAARPGLESLTDILIERDYDDDGVSKNGHHHCKSNQACGWLNERRGVYEIL